MEVSPEVYYAYFRMERQERGQEEKKQRNAVVSYDALDSDETVGLETMPDLTSPSMEDLMVMRVYEQYAQGASMRELLASMQQTGVTYL